MSEKYLGRIVKEKITFFVEGTFESMYAAQSYLYKNNYGYGSTSVCNPVAFMKGEYILPQKWHNISDEGRKLADGVMVSDDFREGHVDLIFFEPIKATTND